MRFSTGVVAAAAVLAAIAALSAWSGWRMRRFLARTPALRTADDLDYLRRVVAADMYSALAAIGLCVLAAAIVLVSLATGRADWNELPWLVVPSMLLLAVGLLWCRPAETRVKQIPADDETLREKRDAVLTAWTTKSLPDW